MKLDFNMEKSAKDFLTEISASAVSNPKKMEKIQNNTGLTKDEIMALIYEKSDKRLHINLKPTLYALIERCAEKNNCKINTFISNLLLKEVFKKKL